MSEQEQGTQEEALALAGDPSTQLTEILDFLAPEAAAEETPEPAEAGGAVPPEAGPDEGGAEGGVEPTGDDGAEAPRDAGSTPVQDDGTAPPAGDTGPGAERVSGSVDAETLADSWGEISTGFENAQTEYLRQQTLAEIQEEFKPYFDRLRMHPRTLVGEEVQSLSHDGKETLRDAADAAQWQEAAKHLLVQTIEDRVATKQQELQGSYATVHASIDLFRNNSDLVPGTKQFDKELADEFAAMVKDYEVRSDGKLIGYSVPVQPLINQLRNKRTAARTAAAAPPAPTPQQQRAAGQQRSQDTGRWEAPQTGITSKAGSSRESDDVAAGVMEAFFRQNGMRF